MKIAYVYLNKINSKDANINQTFNMASALGNFSVLTLFSAWISKKELYDILKFFWIKKTFVVKTLPISLNTQTKSLEKISRGLYSFIALIFVKFNKYDIVYTRDFSFLYFISLLPKFLRPKQKILFENHIIYHRASSKVSFEQEKKALSQADYFLPISKGIKNELISLFNISEKRILILPDGVNLRNFTKIKINKKFLRIYGLKQNDKKIVYSGSFLPWKGVETLVRSSKYIKHPVKIILVGGRGKDKERIQKLIKDEKVGGEIILLDLLPQKNLIRILKLADIGVIPNISNTSISEKYTSPLKLFEYMACGLPIICSDLPSLKEILKEKNNCFFFKPGNEKDLAKKIDELLGCNSIRKKIVINNLKNIKRYSWENRAKNVINFLEDHDKKTL